MAYTHFRTLDCFLLPDIPLLQYNPEPSSHQVYEILCWPSQLQPLLIIVAGARCLRGSPLSWTSKDAFSISGRGIDMSCFSIVQDPVVSPSLPHFPSALTNRVVCSPDRWLIYFFILLLTLLGSHQVVQHVPLDVVRCEVADRLPEVVRFPAGGLHLSVCATCKIISTLPLSGDGRSVTHDRAGSSATLNHKCTCATQKRCCEFATSST